MLYIVCNRNFLLDYYFEDYAHGEDKNVEVVYWDREFHKGSFKAKLLRNLDYYLGLTPRGGDYFTEEFVERIKSIKVDDKILYYSTQNLKTLKLINRIANPKTKRFVWLWDSLSTFKSGSLRYQRKVVRELHRLADVICSFDITDVKRYGFKYLSQVYKEPSAEFLAKNSGLDFEYDLFFVGHDKPGRMELIGEIADNFVELGYRADVCIVPCGKIPRVEKYSNYYKCSNKISANKGYEVSLKALMQSRVILDVLQSGQQGMTLRCVEAMYFSKKIITNNMLVKNEPFYHPSRIFIWQERNREELRDFIESDFEPLDRALLEGYELKNWLKNFY